jgi:hypothetical protein
LLCGSSVGLTLPTARTECESLWNGMRVCASLRGRSSQDGSVPSCSVDSFLALCCDFDSWSVLMIGAKVAHHSFVSSEKGLIVGIGLCIAKWTQQKKAADDGSHQGGKIVQ